VQELQVKVILEVHQQMWDVVQKLLQVVVALVLLLLP
jgi:hypothetical protein